MSLYNMIMEVDPFAGLILKLLQLKPDAIPRFRDAYINKDGSRLVVFTRTGGDNRTTYADANQALASHPLYERDEDWAFDPTFAYWYFKVPEPVIDDIKTMAIAYGREPAGDRYHDLIGRLNDPKHANDKDVERAHEVGSKIADAIISMPDGGVLKV